MAENSPEKRIRETSKYTRRIAFLGTPHHGSDLAKWGDLARTFVNCFADTNKELLRDLDGKSEKLTRLGSEFPKLLRRRAEVGKAEDRIEVMCYFEELKYKKMKIVSETSACLSGYDSASLRADHIEICKFEDKDDSNYERVAETLERWVRELKTASQSDAQKQATYYAEQNISGGTHNGITGAMFTGDVRHSVHYGYPPNPSSENEAPKKK